MFCLSQFGMPTTGLGAKLGMPTAQLPEPSKDTGIYKFSHVFSLVENRTSYEVTFRRRP